MKVTKYKRNGFAKALLIIILIVAVAAVCYYVYTQNVKHQGYTEYTTGAVTTSTPQAGTEDEKGEKSETGEVVTSTALIPYEPHDLITVDEVPEYSGQAYIVIDDNDAAFDDDELVVYAFEYYSPLDELGRCGYCVANVCKATMPTEARGSISSVKPSGWINAKYDFVDGSWLYNRCHLIGWQLTAENANKQNLITGTRYMNISGMLPFENEVADYVKETGNHVMYLVYPLFEENNLVAIGVQMMAQSVEDNGEGIEYNIFAYNVQPGVVIDYATGKSSAK